MSLPTEKVLTRSVVVEAPPEEVWEALTDPGRLQDWFADSVEGDLREEESEVVFAWADGERREAVVESVRAPERLELWWWRDGDPDGSRVTFELVPAVGGTRVFVVESGTTAASRLPRLAASCSLALAFA